MGQYWTMPFKKIMVAAALSIAALAGGGCAAAMLMNPLPSAEIAANTKIPNIPAARFGYDQLSNDPVKALAKLGDLGRDRSSDSGKLAYSLANDNNPKSIERPVVNILAISGGGPDGAFAAGLLTAWGETGNRPRFEIVTGVSAGALIAPIVFLNKKNDDRLERMWNKTSVADLVSTQFLSLLFGGSAIAQPWGIVKLVNKHVTSQMLKDIAREYRDGRLLLIGTTNIGTGRPVIWNMGEIAVRGDVRLFRTVMLASAAVPFLFPPVQIDVVSSEGEKHIEVHVDGGVTKNAFIGPERLDLAKLATLYPGHLGSPLFRLYVIRNAKMGITFDKMQFPTALQIAKRSMETVSVAYNKHNIERIYKLTGDRAGTGRFQAEFRLAAVPPEFTKAESIFVQDYQTGLFNLGRCLIEHGWAWKDKPPAEQRPDVNGWAVKTKSLCTAKK